MKKIVLTLLLILLGIEIDRVIAQDRSRFERLLREKVEGTDGTFEVYHDRESGIEFICATRGVDLGYSISCFPTGRNWK